MGSRPRVWTNRYLVPFMTAYSFTPDIVACRLAASSKKQLLQHVGSLAANHAGLCERAVLSAIMGREKLGSTGVGRGLALPHAILEDAKDVVTLLATLDSPVDFDAPDDVAVDAVVLVLGAKHDSSEYLAAINAASRALNQRGDAIRAAGSETAIRGILSETVTAAA